jgi:ATP sulfurylase
MNRLASAKLFATESKMCDKCGMHNKKHGCCHDETKLLKVQDAQQHALAVKALLAPSTLIQPSFESIIITSYKDDLSKETSTHSPPLLCKQEVYIQNCVFRI